MPLMSPMDAFSWFDLPRVTQFDTINAGDQLCGLETRRVCLILQSRDGAGVLSVTPAFDPARSVPQGLCTSDMPLILTQQDNGPLCQCAWFCGNNLTAGATVIELLLREWPHEGK